MTTICYRDGIMAADSAIFDRGCYCGDVLKLSRAADGTIGGAAGSLGVISKFAAWLDAGAIGDPPPIPPNDESEAIWVRPDNEVWWLGPGSLPTHLTGAYFAIGSGFRIAMGALAHGATALEAVEICADLDNMTRRPIQALTAGQLE